MRRLTAAITVSLLGAAAASSGTRGPAVERLPVFGPDDAAPLTGPELTVMTLNLAHGRADGRHQLLRSAATLDANLRAAAALIDRLGPDVVALQEADGPSVWSGRFDHVRRLVDASELTHFARAENVRGAGIAYGTAVAARVPLAEAFGHTFAASWPTFAKGFTRALVPWEAAPGGGVEVVSVHLDFASARARDRQVDRLIDVLARHPDRLRVVLGDFNCAWHDQSCPLPRLARALALDPVALGDPRRTFPARDTRLDWILISSGLEAVGYDVVEATVSDHRPVMARLRLR